MTGMVSVCGLRKEAVAGHFHAAHVEEFHGHPAGSGGKGEVQFPAEGVRPNLYAGMGGEALSGHGDEPLGVHPVQPAADPILQEENLRGVGVPHAAVGPHILCENRPSLEISVDGRSQIAGLTVYEFHDAVGMEDPPPEDAVAQLQGVAVCRVLHQPVPPVHTVVLTRPIVGV